MYYIKKEYLKFCLESLGVWVGLINLNFPVGSSEGDHLFENPNANVFRSFPWS